MDDLKIKAQEAKRRLKTGFWEKHKDKIGAFKDKAKTEGMDSSNIIKYYQTNITCEIKPKSDENELFYSKVKSILDSVGEVSDIIRRLIDDKVYASLPYERKQKYIMELSEKYRIALSRYKREKKFDLKELNI